MEEIKSLQNNNNKKKKVPWLLLPTFEIGSDAPLELRILQEEEARHHHLAMEKTSDNSAGGLSFVSLMFLTAAAFQPYASH